MHIRPTTAADIPRCVTIRDAAFVDNELVNWLAPDRAKYPLAWRQRALAVQRNKLYQSNAWQFVCVADTDDDFAAVGEILGWARWVRRASEEEAAADPWTRQLSVLDRVESWLRWAELKFEQAMYTSPALIQARDDAFMASAMTSTGFAPIRAATHWHLETLAVDPKYQRRGVARRLVDWGLQRAEAETEERVARGKPPVPITLIATAPGLPLYRSMGLKVVGWDDASYMGFPVEGGSNMIWDASNYWIRDVEYEEPMERGVVEAVYSDSVLPKSSSLHAI
ncbi:hypothetical protein LTR85_005459 [Meristemomyces frigidus]|nr:hypothetical protein LTR85_005459 [Meristemomyces frigidus]